MGSSPISAKSEMLTLICQAAFDLLEFNVVVIAPSSRTKTVLINPAVTYSCEVVIIRLHRANK